MCAAKIKIEEGLTIESLVKELINTSGERVILEVAEGATLLSNEINLRLLKFYAEEEEKEIVINSEDPMLMGLAHKFGISTLKENHLTFPGRRIEPEAIYQKAEIEIAASPETGVETTVLPWTQWQGGLPFAIIISMFSLILACWWFFQPRAVIMVYPKEQALTFSTGAQIGTTFNAQELLDGKIPAKILEKDNQIKLQTVTTGAKIVGVTPAVGRVTLINSTGQPVVLPKGSVVTGKAGVRFLTNQDVLVPKRQTKYRDGIAVGEEYGRAEANITAEKKGTIGNQPSKSITMLSGKYQRFLKIINSSPTKNGSDKKVAVVTLNDVKKGENEAKRQMQLVGSEEIATLTGSEYLCLSELVRTEIIRVVNLPDIGAESDSLQTNLDYRTSVLTPLTDDILKYLDRKFEENIPPGFQAKSERVVLTAAKPSQVGDGKAQLRLTGRGLIKGVLEAGKIKNLIKGKTKVEALSLLTKQNEVSRFKIDLKDNSDQLPPYAFQIKVVFPAGS